MAKEYIRQHIVPACYLANFGINGNQGRKTKIYYHLEGKNISGLGTVDDFPTERNFYDISELGENEKILELFFQKIENEYSELLKELICTICFERDNRTSLTVNYSEENKNKLCAQFAMQIERTHQLRNDFKSIYEQLKSSAPWYQFPEYGKDDFKRLQNTQILSFDMANLYANIFKDKKWIILVNHTDIPFFTSDNPIISINHGKEKSVSVASDDLTYYIPISPLYAIEMYPKTVKWNDLCYFDIFYQNYINVYNYYIEKACTRMIFSNKDFNVIKNLLKNSGG